VGITVIAVKRAAFWCPESLIRWQLVVRTEAAFWSAVDARIPSVTVRRWSLRRADLLAPGAPVDAERFPRTAQWFHIKHAGHQRVLAMRTP
jgi:hypothetical protein